MKILVTGAAGFIGFHIARRFLGRGDSVVGIDGLNGCDPDGPECLRLSGLGIRDAASTLAENRGGDGSFPAPSRFCGKFRFYLCDATDKRTLQAVFERECFDLAVNSEARDGDGFLNVLECCSRFNVTHKTISDCEDIRK